VPCSWGAIYFPEHWREFHTYLAFRLSSTPFPLNSSTEQDVVPHSRSNGWTHSWKRYFIELAYLRGYVMLYPNFPGYTSLSTNHLEPGAHVHDRPREVLETKRRLFVVPLMPLPAVESGSDYRRTGLLDLPNGLMPNWFGLPVTDLFGLLSSLITLEDRGRRRIGELISCPFQPSIPFSVHNLLCISLIPNPTN
jgi:hypothetical protein